MLHRTCNYLLFIQFKFSQVSCVSNCLIWRLYVQFSSCFQNGIEIGKTRLSFRLRKEDAFLFASRLSDSASGGWGRLSLQTLPLAPADGVSHFSNGLGTQGNACDSVPREWRGPVWPDSNSVFQSPPASISCLTFFYLVKTRARLGKMRAFPSALKQDEVKLKFRISQPVFESLLSLPR